MSSDQMKMSTLSSLLVLMSVVSMVAIAPNAFAMHHEVTITNAPGSATPGCEETNNCFIPSVATIEAGGTVTWENTDNAAHTATSGSATDGPDGVFDSSLMMVDGSFSHTFDTAGTYDYFCMVHPWMSGTVIVEAAGAAEAEAEAAAAEAAAADAAAAEAAAAEAAAAEAAAAEAAVTEAIPPTMSVGSTTTTGNTGPGDMLDLLDWTISNGDVLGMHVDEEASSLVIDVDTTDDGELFVALNADYIGSDDGTFFIIVDGEEWQDYEQAGMDLYIDIPAGTELVEIVGSYAVPEFGTIAMIILAVAIVSIIAITAKTRTTLIPKL